LILSNKLNEVSNETDEISMKKQLIKIFETIQGEWAFIYYQVIYYI